MSGLPYRTGHASRGDSGEWPGIWPRSYECEHNCVPGRVGIPTLMLGAGRFT